MKPRFDWYQGTVSAEVPAIREALLARACDGPRNAEPMKRAPHGYAFGERIDDMDGQVAMIWWGGMHERPHVVSSGESAALVAGVLRSEFGGGRHTVSRADICTDYAEPGAYDRLQSVALEVARERRIKVGTAGDHLVTMCGRTVYLGAKSSHTRLRIYDKAAELREKFQHDAQRLSEVPSELARFECQVRPQTPEGKAAAACAEPVAMMGSAAWMRELVQRVEGLELQPFQAGRAWRQSDDARSYDFMLAQWGGLLQRLASDLGSWECLGLQLRDDLSERASLKRRGLA